MAGGGVALIGTTLVPLLTGLADVLAAFRKGSIPANAMDMITEEETDHD